MDTKGNNAQNVTVRVEVKVFSEEKENIRLSIGEAVCLRIEQLKREKDLKQYQVAEEGTVPQTTLISIKKKRSKSPGIKTLYRICEGFDISLKEFFNSKLFDRDNLILN